MEKFEMAQLFRKSSIEKLSSPEQLDKSIVVTSPMSWVVLLGIGLIIVCFVIWAFCGTMPTTLEARGIVSNGIYTNSIYSDVTGIVENILVTEGETVDAGKVIATIIDEANTKHNVEASESCVITNIEIETGSKVNYTDELFGISPVSNNDGFIVFYVGLEQVPSIKIGMDVVINMPTFDNQKYGHMKGSIVHVDSMAATEESITRVMGKNESVLEYYGAMNQPVVAVTCKIEKDNESENGYYWSNENGEKLSVKYGNVADVKIVMDEKAPITKLIPGLE